MKTHAMHISSISSVGTPRTKGPTIGFPKSENDRGKYLQVDTAFLASRPIREMRPREIRKKKGPTEKDRRRRSKKGE